jgi:hypothetical protein
VWLRSCGSRQGQEFFSSLKFMYWVLSPPILLLAWVMVDNFPWCKVARLKAGHSVSFSAEVGNGLSNTSTLPYAAEA